MTDGYDEDEEYTTADWLNWLPDLLSAIEEGHFDTKLKEIAKAAIIRKQVLDGKVAPPTDGSTESQQLASGAVRYVGPVLGEGDVPKVPWTYGKAGTIRVSDNFYPKSAIEGKVVRLKVSGRNWFLNDLLVKVVGTGSVNAQVRFAEDPTTKHPDSYKLLEYWTAQQANASWQLRVPYLYLASALVDATES